ncbi:amino acid ABC transporter substrate-binding protein, partial [Klebsiella pneumoniae]|nr:amino acid ABC transporter substrate-binding protein [Klebsiella pneumoniae]
MNKVRIYKPFTLLLMMMAFVFITAACSTAQNGTRDQKTAWEQLKEKGKIVVATSGT